MFHLRSAVVALVCLAAATSAVPVLGSGGQAMIGTGFNLTWSAVTAGNLQVCLSAAKDPSIVSEYIALGFASKPENKMTDVDIVAAWSAAGTPTFKTYYGVAPAGYPNGTSTLTISGQTFTSTTTTLTMCFTRAVSGGHNPLTSTGSVIWAVGPVEKNDIYYHGSDPADPTGKTQKHRSDETPVINWLGSK